MVTIAMRRGLIAMLMMATVLTAWSQEVLVPLECPPVAGARRLTKQSAEPLRLPFFDDFSNYMGAPDPTLWVEDQAFVGRGYGSKPPTLGMMTLDAIDGQGRLHAGASTELFGGDTATSVAIRLDTVWADEPRALTPADSVVLSFYYLPGGGSGNQWERVTGRPSEGDSLFLEFYMPRADRWVTVWSRGGISVDSLVATTGKAWQYVAVAVTDTAYFDSTFRFRFRNYCSLPNSTKPGRAANCDQWNIDYVLLDHSRNTRTAYFDDVAFVDDAPTMLAHYTAMPARQFATADMAQNVQMTITNLYSAEIATYYAYTVYNPDGSVLSTYNGGNNNAPSFPLTGGYQTAAPHATPPVNFVYATGPESRTYTVVHVVREGTGDTHPQNDTVVFYQVFDNYYAYDDGTPENGYGLSTTGKLAYRFDLRVADTLTAVDLYFNRTLNGDNERIPFYLTVWSCEGGRPGRQLYRDTRRRYAQFDGLNRYCRYALEQAVVVADTVFVGIEQLNANFLNLGFDRGRNTADRIYCLYGTEWEQSILSGSLMLRPCFGASATAQVAAPTSEPLAVYPVPAADRLYMQGTSPSCTLRVVDVYGRVWLTVQGATELDVSALPQGMYLLRADDAKNGTHSTTKFVISR